MGIFTFVVNSVALFCVFSGPFALDSMGWTMYMMNGSWDLLEVLFIWFQWVETSGKTLEEIDAVFDGRKHSDAPDLEDVMSAPDGEERSLRHELREGYGTVKATPAEPNDAR